MSTMSSSEQKRHVERLKASAKGVGGDYRELIQGMTESRQKQVAGKKS